LRPTPTTFTVQDLLLGLFHHIPLLFLRARAEGARAAVVVAVDLSDEGGQTVACPTHPARRVRAELDLAFGLGLTPVTAWLTTRARAREALELTGAAVAGDLDAFGPAAELLILVAGGQAGVYRWPPPPACDADDMRTRGKGRSVT
jgi:hypothetical protein